MDDFLSKHVDFPWQVCDGVNSPAFSGDRGGSEVGIGTGDVTLPRVEKRRAVPAVRKAEVQAGYGRVIPP